MPGTGRCRAVVLAAGEGTRMRSATPKVLHPLCGRPMLLHVLDTLVAAPARAHRRRGRPRRRARHQDAPGAARHRRAGRVRRADACSAAPATPSASALTAVRRRPRPSRTTSSSCRGDIPLLRAETLATLATEHRLADAAATLLTAGLDDPTGYGRIVRDAQGRVDRIVEQTDADPEELAIDEVNPSIYCFRRGLLAPALRRLSPENAQGEYYLTDVVEVLRQAGHACSASRPTTPTEALGVNDRAQLADAEAELRAPHQRPVDARGRHDGRPRPHLHRHHRRARARRAAAARARSSRGAPSSAPAR